jgi:general secretion pathway protein F
MSRDVLRQQAFNYRAVDAAGVTQRGIVQAADEAAAVRELLGKGLTPLELRSDARPGAPSSVRTSHAGASPSAARRAPSLADRLALLQEMATLLSAGVSMAEALPSLAQSYAAQALGAPIAVMEREVRSGKRLSEALRTSGLPLPPYVFALVEAGEASGNVAQALADAAEQMDHDRRAAQELRSALIYPSVLVLAGTVAVFIVFVGVVPRFAGLLKSSHAEVPELSRWIISAGLYVKTHLLGVGLGAAAAVGTALAAFSQPATRAAVLEGATGLPVIGPWLVRGEVGRWAQVLSTLLANRVPIVQAIALSSGALRLQRLRQDLASAGRELEMGRSLSEVLETRAWFPAARLNLVRVGERSGELPRMLGTLGSMETEAARLLQKRALALIEPAAILLIGAVIGVIMVAVMMAITSLNTVAL